MSTADHIRLAQAALEDALSTLQAPALPSWYVRARGELGVREIGGRAHEKRIVAYHATTAAGAAPDEVPWCSSFVNWAMETEGYEGTDSKRARSWLNWGESVDEPYEGCVVVLSRGSNPAHGHVGFYVRDSRGFITVLGGNQGNKVAVDLYPRARLLGYRQPTGYSAVG